MLLKTYTHIEVIKRCPEIIKFLAENNKLDIGVLDLVWEAAQGTHDSVIRAVYNLITDVSPMLNAEHKDYIFALLVQSPEWDEKLINTLKEFSTRATTTPDNLYALPYFYDHVTA
jgi:hypothetical protein